MKNKKKTFYLGGWVGSGGGWARAGGGGVRVDVKKEVKFCENSKKSEGRSGWWVVRSGGGVGGGQGGCERNFWG